MLEIAKLADSSDFAANLKLYMSTDSTFEQEGQEERGGIKILVTNLRKSFHLPKVKHEHKHYPEKGEMTSGLRK